MFDFTNGYVYFCTNHKTVKMNKFIQKSAGVVTLIALSLNVQSQIGNETLGAGAGASLTSGDYDTFIGDSAGTSTTSGLNNTFVGEQSGFSNTTAADNTFIGHDAGRANTTGTDNTFVGKQAGLNSTATDNTFIGTQCGYSNTSGSDNTFVGETAGMYNTTGRDNTFMGEDAGYNNTDGDDNTFIGSTAGRTNTTGYRCTFVGNESGYDNKSGHHNTGIGDSSLTDCGTGSWNTALGAAAGAATEHSSYTTFVGAYTGWDNNRNNATGSAVNGDFNTYVGAYAGYTNRQGTYNTGMGTFSKFNATTVNRNSFLGAEQDVWNDDNVILGYGAYTKGSKNFVAGTYVKNDNNNNVFLVGYQAYASTSGDEGIGIGYRDTIAANRAISIGHDAYTGGVDGIGIGAYTRVVGDSSLAFGRNATVTGNNSIAIGADASVTGENSIAIGKGASASSNNEVYIGNSSITSIGGVVNWTATSDGRFKSNVQENVPGLGFINKLRPVTYNLNGDQIDAFFGKTSTVDKDAKEIVSTGFIAQEVEKAATDLGYDFSGVKVPEDSTTEIYGIRYAEFVVPLVKATQELSAQIKAQKEEITSQKNVIDKYQQAFIQMQKQMNVLEAKIDAVQNGDNTSVSNTQTVK